jgi:hypothetical protein
MIEHQFSKHFSPDTDNDFKNEQFEKKLAEFIVMFVECYPNLISKKIEGSKEVWVFRFSVNVK